MKHSKLRNKSSSGKHCEITSVTPKLETLTWSIGFWKNWCIRFINHKSRHGKCDVPLVEEVSTGDLSRSCSQVGRVHQLFLGPRGLRLQCFITIWLNFSTLKTELIKSIWKSKWWKKVKNPINPACWEALCWEDGHTLQPHPACVFSLNITVAAKL